MKRGDLVIVNAGGDWGKPPPALVIQSDILEDLSSVLVCLLSATLSGATTYRLRIDPSPANGLKTVSEVQTDKIAMMRREKCEGPIGRLSPEQMDVVDRNLAFVTGLADSLRRAR